MSTGAGNGDQGGEAGRDRWVRAWRDHVGSRPEKHHKATLFRSDNLLLGLNCLDPGQTQRVHTHEGQDKFYLVLEGTGYFTVAQDRFEAGAGEVVWAPAGVEHGVVNRGAVPLVLAVGIAPAPGA